MFASDGRSVLQVAYRGFECGRVRNATNPDSITRNFAFIIKRI